MTWRRHGLSEAIVVTGVLGLLMALAYVGLAHL